MSALGGIGILLASPVSAQAVAGAAAAHPAPQRLAEGVLADAALAGSLGGGAYVAGRDAPFTADRPGRGALATMDVDLVVGPMAARPFARPFAIGQQAGLVDEPADSKPDSSEGITVTGRGPPPPSDPARAINLKTYAVMQGADRLVIAPLAMGYKHALPEPARDGLHNALYNLREPAVAVNFLLQHRVGKAFETAGRFAINSTVGVVGLFDLAKRRPFNLPWRRNGFAYTLGFYGVKPGPYFFLPIIGPTTLRDFVGLIGDRFTFPLIYGPPMNTPAFGFAVTVIGGLDDRMRNDAILRQFRETDDMYSNHRDYYLRKRQAEINLLHWHRRSGAELAPPPPFVPAPVVPASVMSAPVVPVVAAPAPAPVVDTAAAPTG